MQHGGFDINDYFPGGSADLDSIERDLQGFTPVQSNQINTELTREIRGLRADLKKSDRRCQLTRAPRYEGKSSYIRRKGTY